MARGEVGKCRGLAGAAFGPTAIAIPALVVTDFASEIVGLPGILIDQGVVEVGPVVRKIGFRGNLDISVAAFQLEYRSHEGRLHLGSGAAEGIPLPKYFLITGEKIAGHQERKGDQ